MYDTVLMGAWGAGSWLPWTRKDIISKPVTCFYDPAGSGGCPVSQLSRAAAVTRITRALVIRPLLLLLDDPSGCWIRREIRFTIC